MTILAEINFLPVMKIRILIAIILLCQTSVFAQSRSLSIIPQPNSIKVYDGNFKLDGNVALASNLEGNFKQDFYTYLGTTPLSLALSHGKAGDKTIDLHLEPRQELPNEAYSLEVSENRIRVEASSESGIFHAVQTLLQMIDNQGNIPCSTVRDFPEFEYRGLMLDLSRHFFPASFIKKQIDLLGFYKINMLHLHLTDSGGWRMEIKKYPLLTEKTAWRPEIDWTKWWIGGMRSFCAPDSDGAYGGYLTQNELRDIVSYAKLRGITVIPEIEMPGHSMEVTAAYPELACPGQAGKGSELCIGNERTFEFIEEVLTEVMEVFPSEYIHIGGDEAGHEAWKNCPKCQERMRVEGLKDEFELQSYLIKRVDKFLNSKGRHLLGWDEIIEGGLAPNAKVMSWRGETGGIAAAKMGHDVVMTPGPFCYLDKYQDAPSTQPKAIGGYLPLEKVYAYNPVPDTLTHLRGFFKGVQGNLWTEYVETPGHVEYMIYPRIIALAETGWTAKENKDWDSFRKRVAVHLERNRKRGYNSFDFQNATGDRPEFSHIIGHKAFGKKVSYQIPYSTYYPADGESSLTDGKRGNWTYDSPWQGFLKGLNVVVDLDESTDIHKISLSFFHSLGVEIYLPEIVRLSVSDDGINFRRIYERHLQFRAATDYEIKDISWKGADMARYIKVEAYPNPLKGGWIFTDEIVVE